MVPRREIATTDPPNVLFDSQRYGCALTALRQRLRVGVAVDQRWLPDLIEVGGATYESGHREFEDWAAGMESLLGESVRSLLQEAWNAIPQAATERLKLIFSSALSHAERLRVARAYHAFKFSGPAAPTSEQEQEPGLHRHDCISCGMSYVHQA